MLLVIKVSTGSNQIPLLAINFIINASGQISIPFFVFCMYDERQIVETVIQMFKKSENQKNGLKSVHAHFNW